MMVMMRSCDNLRTSRKSRKDFKPLNAHLIHIKRSTFRVRSTRRFPITVSSAFTLMVLVPGAYFFCKHHTIALVVAVILKRAPGRGASEDGVMVYANALRCIGQELESRDIEVFEVKSYANEFRVQAGDPNYPYTGLINIKLSAEQIEVLERRSQASRGKSNEQMKFDSMPNILRAVGEYIDKHGYLRRVDTSCPPIADQLAIEVEYETRAGAIRLETLPMSVIREASVSMYKKRAHRPDILSFFERK
jgi:hypothetical protein